MFGIGGTELFLILLFAFLIFGPDKLPGMGRTIGRALRQFKQAQEGFTQVVQSEVLDPAAEAMNASAGKPTRNRAAELDEDADLDAPEGEDAPAPRRTETFAERKKRLAAEKAAREAEAKQAAAAAEDAEKSLDAADSDADLDADTDADAAIAKGAAAKPQPAGAKASKPAGKPTAADLYSMKRPSRPVNAVGSRDGCPGARPGGSAGAIHARAGRGGAGRPPPPPPAPPPRPTRRRRNPCRSDPHACPSWTTSASCAAASPSSWSP